MKRLNTISLKYFCCQIVMAVLILCSFDSTQMDERKNILDKVMESYTNQQWEEALKHINSLKSLDDTLDILPIEAECYAGIGQYSKAISMLESAIKTGDRDDIHYLYQTLGNIYYFKKDYNNSLANYKKVIELRPSYARPYINIAEIYQMLGNPENSIDYYLTAISLFLPNGFNDEVIEFSQRVLSMDPGNVDAHNACQYSLLATHQFEDALNIGVNLGKILLQKDANAKIPAQSILLTGMSAFHCREYEMATSFLGNILQQEELSDEDAWLAICYLSAAYYKQGQEESAKQLEKIAVENDAVAESFIKNLCDE